MLDARLCAHQARCLNVQNPEKGIRQSLETKSVYAKKMDCLQFGES